MRATPARAGARHSSSPALHRTIGIAVCGFALLTSSCTVPASGDERTTRVLQAVNVSLEPDGRIRALSGNAVFVSDESGSSWSESTKYEVPDVVDDLPIRITTRYRAGERTGSDLDDLRGHHGRIELEITLENLLVSPENLTYDAAGESRTSPALVGTPLSVAASALLPGVRPSSVDFEVESPRRTNGVVSATSEGSAVQWSAVLAPPRSEATATFTLAADVTDFAVPAIDIAVQAGLHTDLSFAGVAASAFADPTADLEAQQEMIELISEVNGVLTRAGTTITEVRRNLRNTSGTLGVRASQRLAASSKQLTSMMRSLAGQVDALEESLDESLNGASSAVRSELARIVTSITSLLGKTSGEPPELVDGNGCATKLKHDDQKDPTVFSMFLHLSSLLEGYADAAEGCRDEILSAVDTLIGPAEPDQFECAALTTTSATCALFSNAQSVLASLDELLLQGQAIAAGIDTTTIDEGLSAHDDLATALEKTGTAIADAKNTADGTDTWISLLTQVESAQSSAAEIAELRAELIDIRDALEPGGSEFEQQKAIAEMLCELMTNGGASDVDGVEEVRAQIVDARCDGSPHEAGDVPAEGPSTKRMSVQGTALDASIAKLDANAPASAVHKLEASLASLHDAIELALEDISNDSGEIQQSVKQLQQLHAAATAQSNAVRVALEAALTEQDLLGDQIDGAFQEAKDQSANAINSDAMTQISDLNAQREDVEDTLSASYQSLIEGLRASASSSIADGRELVTGQKAEVRETQRQASKAIDERTRDALRSIERSTTAATRDIRSASAQMSGSLKSVILDLGNPKVKGSGILGALLTNAAKSNTADYQLALASQYVSGYANVREEDVSGILLRQAQFRAVLERTAALEPFHLDIPSGATSQTIYTITLGGGVR